MKPNVFGFYVKDEIMQDILLVQFLLTTTIYFFPRKYLQELTISCIVL